MPRSLVFRYKGLQADPATVGLALNARTILTGRVVQQGDVLNIQAELVDTATESQLWGEQFRQKIAELMVVQEEIAWQISEALRLKLTGEQKNEAAQAPHRQSRGVPGVPARPVPLEQLEAGGLPARARALRARDRVTIPRTRWPMPASPTRSVRWPTTASSRPRTASRAPRAAAMRAIELDPDIADAHVVARRSSLLFWERDWAARSASSKTAISLEPAAGDPARALRRSS